MSKFNKKTRGSNWWPIKQFRFDTAKHPVLKSGRGRPAPVAITYKEKQMLEGLARILQCDEITALRIAVYEFQTADFIHASLITDATALYEKNKQMGVSLSSSLKKEQEQKAKALGVSYKQSLRMALMWLARGIRSETITRLTNSRRIGQQKLAEEWKKTGGNAHKKGVLQNLHGAYERAGDSDYWTEEQWAEWDEKEAHFKARGEFVKANRLGHLWGSDEYGNGWMDVATVEGLMAVHKDEAVVEQGGDLREHRLQEYLSYGLTQEEAEQCVAEEFDAESQELSDEELEALEESFMLTELSPVEKEKIAKQNEEMLAKILDDMSFDDLI